MSNTNIAFLTAGYCSFNGAVQLQNEKYMYAAISAITSI